MWRLTLLVSILLVSSAGAQSQSDVPGSADIWVELKQNTHALRVAIPELAAASPDVRADAADVYRILFDDISFASVFRIVDPERYELVKTLSAGFDYHGWESIGSDIVITGTVARENQALRAAIHVHAVENEKTAFSTVYTEYRGSTRNLAHNVANRILAQFGLVGIATTDIVFASDRDSETGSKNLWMMDYDGFGQCAITRNRYLDFQPRFSPDGAKLSFLSYPKKNAPPVLAIHGEGPLLEGPGMLFSASWSPDGKRIAFSSTRDEAGNAEIYVMNRDGTAIRRLTHHPGIDVSPSWSPTGRELVFTSERTGSPQIFVMDAEGLNLRRLSRGGLVQRRAILVPLQDSPRDRLCLTRRRTPIRHRSLRPHQTTIAPTDVSVGDERERELVSRRKPSRLHVHAQRRAAGLHHESRRRQPAAAHLRRHEHHAELGSAEAEIALATSLG